MISDLSIDYIKWLLAYDPVTGAMTWNVDRSSTARKGDNAGSMHKDGYLQIKFRGYGCSSFCHRLAVVLMTGAWPDGEVDHINGIRTDNRWENLRLVSRSQNMRNRKIGRRNTSGIMGVHWCKRFSCWKARIDKDGEKFNLGSFRNLLDAASARKSAEMRLDFHINHGRKK